MLNQQPSGSGVSAFQLNSGAAGQDQLSADTSGNSVFPGFGGLGGGLGGLGGASGTGLFKGENPFQKQLGLLNA